MPKKGIEREITEEENENHQRVPWTYLRRVARRRPTQVSTVFCITALLLGLAPVAGEVQTLFRDDFNDQRIGILWDAHELGTGSIHVLDGFGFLNLSKATSQNAAAAYIESHSEATYAGMEVRMKCNDDNKLESDLGGGMRFWGLVDKRPMDNGLFFISACPESDPGIPGFRVERIVNGERESAVITGAEMGEWHVYTILWDKNNATLLVDGEVVASFDTVPTVRLASNVYLSNFAVRGSPEQSPAGNSYVPIDTASDQSIQVDYVHMFDIPETCLLAVLGLIMALLVHPQGQSGE